MLTFFGFCYYYLIPFRSLFSVLYIWAVGRYFLSKPSISVIDFVLVTFLIIKLYLESLNVGIIAALLYLRLYWGFFFFYLYFKKKTFDFFNIACVFAFFTCLEFVLIHTVPQYVVLLPNYSQPEVISEYIQASGLFAGAYGFGGNRTVTGTILLASYVYYQRRDSKQKYLLLFGSIFAVSGVALGLLFLVLLAQSSNLAKVTMNKIMLGGFGAVFFLWFVSGDNPIFYRFSLKYLFEFIYQYKIDQIKEALDIIGNWGWKMFFGHHSFSSENVAVDGYGLHFGDFSMLEFFVQYGLLGLALLFILVASKQTLRTRTALFVLLAGTFHYHIIFSLPGQIFLGYLLAQKKPKLKLFEK
jgi:hypothetical protein